VSEPSDKQLDPPERTTEEPAEPKLGDLLRSDAFRADVIKQIGGWRGIVESSVPVAVFVVANILTELKPALIASVASALLIAGVRLLRRQSPRQALNGLFGIALAAFIAYRSGRAEAFYLPGIWISSAYSAVFFLSVLFRRPLVGAAWAFIAGRKDWRSDPRLYRAFTWLTLLWGVVWVAKVGAQAAMYYAGASATSLGVARLTLGYPPILLLVIVTLWQVRRMTKDLPPAEGAAPVDADGAEREPATETGPV
jgi:hypothetical protein